MKTQEARDREERLKGGRHSMQVVFDKKVGRTGGETRKAGRRRNMEQNTSKAIRRRRLGGAVPT